MSKKKNSGIYLPKEKADLFGVTPRRKGTWTVDMLTHLGLTDKERKEVSSKIATIVFSPPPYLDILINVGIAIVITVTLFVVFGCAPKPKSDTVCAETKRDVSSVTNYESLCLRGIGCDEYQKKDLRERIELREKGFMRLDVYPRPGEEQPVPLCEMGFGCELIVDSTGVKYGRPM